LQDKGDEHETTRNDEVKKWIPLSGDGLQTKYLNTCLIALKPYNTPLEVFLQYSAEFPLQFPVNSVLSVSLLQNWPDVSRELLEHRIISAYPVLHEGALTLYISFLEHKKKFGTRKEKELYTDMTVVDLIDCFL
jgi:hypothetical protein